MVVLVARIVVEAYEDLDMLVDETLGRLHEALNVGGKCSAAKSVTVEVEGHEG